MIPAPLSEWVDRDFRTSDGGVLALDLACEGSKHHSPTPLMVYRVSIIPGQDHGPFVMLCGTCKSNLKVFQSLLLHHGEIPWEVQRQFGNIIRELAIRGWRQYPRSANA